MPADESAPDAAAILDSRTAYRGRILDVAVERIRTTPDRSPFEVEIVRHAPSVGIVAMPSEEEIVLVRQYRHAAGAWLWELPAGSVDEGEAPAEAAARECQEELGLVAGSLEPLGSLFPLPGYCTERMTFFKATALRTPGPDDPAACQDEDEDIEAKAFSVSEIRRMLAAGEIVDMKLAAALTLAGRR
ncbi:MAG TPA: NUDIX hydrolase [Vicinamibacterales bacterium]|nr:NUDIX hydrolase [Vicinamibacterales bacterium]